MQLSNFVEKKKNKYLLIPSVPTPNGRLHLGHIGGPFLSADIFARHVQRFGHAAQIIAGTDSYESFVMAKATEEQKAPEEVCHYYHNLIQEDLSTFHINASIYINPLHQKWRDRYTAWNLNVLQLLQLQNVVCEIEETVLWDKQQQRFATGCWISGNCPSCKAEVRGYFCESCGAHFRPEEVNLAQEFRQQHLVETKVKNLFMRITDYHNLENKGISSKLINTFQNFIQQQKGFFRLTASADWGLPLESSLNLPQSTLFNYGLMFAYFLLMGEVAGNYINNGENAFAQDSDVITISTFGLDNAVPFLASINGITANCHAYKAFDYYFINHFYHLNGSKFSTSRNHAIWAKDVATWGEYSTDIARLFLASINVREQHGNIESHVFTKFHDDMTQWIQQRVLKPLLSLTQQNSFDQTLIPELLHYLSKQQHALLPQNYFPVQAADTVFTWQQKMQEINDTSPNYGSWLKGFALLTFPFMPHLSEFIWSRLGNANYPSVQNF